MKRGLSIFMVDDNKDHVNIVRWAFERVGGNVQFRHAENGDLAVRELEALHAHDGAHLPDLIFLDLNLPKIGGKEVLQSLKSHEHLRHIPVIVLSSSDREEDVRTAYALGASTFLTKAMVFSDFEKSIERIHDYWSSIALLPG